MCEAARGLVAPSKSAILFAWVLLAFAGCKESRSNKAVKLEGPDVENSDLSAAGAKQYVDFVLGRRKEKDRFLKEDAGSPLPAEMRSSFKGLEYYPIDPSWGLVLPFIKDPSPPTVTIATNTGEVRRMTREGHVEFDFQGQHAVLYLYREQEGSPPRSPTEGGPDSYWVPFVDAGAGRTTYAAGRYVDVHVEPDGTAVVDFNLAYNPYCAYGWNFVCPVTPKENHLPFLVAAGEKGFHR